jgi:Fic family protein
VPAIASQGVPLPPDLAALADDASAEIARFDAELGHELAPFGAVLLRSESAASSRIENLTASARAIAEAELRPTHTGNVSLIVANTRLMSAAIALADHIDSQAIIKMHDALLGHDAAEEPERFRNQQVWIGGSDFGPHGAMFVPPHHRWVPDAIGDLVAFIERDNVLVLAHAAIAHAQFETIHPFLDGNGRTGRALLHAHLRNKRLTRNVTVPVSAGLLADTDAYFAALADFCHGDIAPIVTQVARASFAAVANGRELVDELRAIRSGWEGRMTARRDAASWKIADLLVRRPVVNARLIASELGMEEAKTYRSLRPLVDAQILVRFTDAKRNQMWRAPEVLEAIDRFAARAGRRTRARWPWPGSTHGRRAPWPKLGELWEAVSPWFSTSPHRRSRSNAPAVPRR